MIFRLREFRQRKTAFKFKISHSHYCQIQPSVLLISHAFDFTSQFIYTCIYICLTIYQPFYMRAYICLHYLVHLSFRPLVESTLWCLCDARLEIHSAAAKPQHKCTMRTYYVYRYITVERFSASIESQQGKYRVCHTHTRVFPTNRKQTHASFAKPSHTHKSI